MKLTSLPANITAASNGAARRTAAAQPQEETSAPAEQSESVDLSSASQLPAPDAISPETAKKIGIGACVVAALSLATVVGIAAGVDAGAIQATSAAGKAIIPAMMTGMASGTVGYAMLRAPHM